MAKILVEMEEFEYAEACAERICSFWKVPKENESMMSDIIEYEIGGLDKVPCVMDFADNFIANWATCQFGAEEVADFIISELEVDLEDIVDFLNLQIENFEFLDLSETQTTLTDLWFEEFKKYLEENDEFDELNYFLQEKTQHKGHYTIVYGESREVCSYIKW